MLSCCSWPQNTQSCTHCKGIIYGIDAYVNGVKYVRHLRSMDNRKAEWSEATSEFSLVEDLCRGWAPSISHPRCSKHSHNHCISGTEQPILRVSDSSCTLPNTALFTTANECPRATEAHIPSYNATWHLVKKNPGTCLCVKWWTSAQICCTSHRFPMGDVLKQQQKFHPTFLDITRLISVALGCWIRIQDSGFCNLSCAAGERLPVPRQQSSSSVKMKAGNRTS